MCSRTLYLRDLPSDVKEDDIRLALGSVELDTVTLRQASPNGRQQEAEIRFHSERDLLESSDSSVAINGSSYALFGVSSINAGGGGGGINDDLIDDYLSLLDDDGVQIDDIGLLPPIMMPIPSQPPFECYMHDLSEKIGIVEMLTFLQSWKITGFSMPESGGNSYATVKFGCCADLVKFLTDGKESIICGETCRPTLQKCVVATANNKRGAKADMPASALAVGEIVDLTAETTSSSSSPGDREIAKPAEEQVENVVDTKKPASSVDRNQQQIVDLMEMDKRGIFCHLALGPSPTRASTPARELDAVCAATGPTVDTAPSEPAETDASGPSDAAKSLEIQPTTGGTVQTVDTPSVPAKTLRTIRPINAMEIPFYPPFCAYIYNLEKSSILRQLVADVRIIKEDRYADADHAGEGLEWARVEVASRNDLVALVKRCSTGLRSVAVSLSAVTTTTGPPLRTVADDTVAVKSAPTKCAPKKPGVTVAEPPPTAAKPLQQYPPNKPPQQKPKYVHPYAKPREMPFQKPPPPIAAHPKMGAPCFQQQHHRQFNPHIMPPSQRLMLCFFFFFHFKCMH